MEEWEQSVIYHKSQDVGGEERKKIDGRMRTQCYLPQVTRCRW